MCILGFFKTIKQKRRINESKKETHQILRIVIRLYYMWTMTYCLVVLFSRNIFQCLCQEFPEQWHRIDLDCFVW